MIQVYLSNFPKVMVDSKEIYFPYKKLECLFYYLVLEKIGDKETVIHYFWPELEEEKAKKNLRNAKYALRKLFGDEIFEKTSRTKLEICSNRVSVMEYQPAFFDEKRYDGFLNGLHIDGLDSLEEYFEEKKIYLERKVEGLFWDATKLANEGEKTQLLEKIIAINPYQEEAYKALIIYNLKRGNLEDAQKIYSVYTNVLKEELGLLPEDRFELLKKQYYRIPKDTIFSGERKELIQELSRKINENSGYEERNHLFLIGETGYGKSYLLRALREQSTCFSVAFKALKSESHLSYRGISLLFKKMIEEWTEKEDSTYLEFRTILRRLFPNTQNTSYAEEIYFSDHNLIENLLVDGFSEFVKTHQVNVFIDDFEFLDTESKRVMGQLLRLVKAKQGIFCMTVAKENEEIIKFFEIENELSERIEKIQLEPFDREMLLKLLKRESSGIKEKIAEEIVELSEGIPARAMEYLQYYLNTGKLKMVIPTIKEMAIAKRELLSQEAQKLLILLSLFHRPFEGSWVVVLSERKPDDIFDLLGELVNKKWLKEECLDGQNPYFLFVHETEREAILEDIPKSKLDFLNRRMRNFYHQRYEETNDTDFLSYGLYHSRQLQDIELVLEDEIFLFEKAFTYQRELFPLLDVSRAFFSKPRTKEQLLKQRKNIEILFKEAEKGRLAFQKYQKHLERFHYLKYKMDMDLLNSEEAYVKMQECYDDYGTAEMKLEVIKTIIYQAIDREDLAVMERFLGIGVQYLDWEPNRIYIPVWKRLYGYLYFQNDSFRPYQPQHFRNRLASG